MHSWSLELPKSWRKASGAEYERLQLRAPMPQDMLRVIGKLWPELPEDPAEWIGDSRSAKQKRQSLVSDSSAAPEQIQASPTAKQAEKAVLGSPKSASKKCKLSKKVSQDAQNDGVETENLSTEASPTAKKTERADVGSPKSAPTKRKVASKRSPKTKLSEKQAKATQSENRSDHAEKHDENAEKKIQTKTKKTQKKGAASATASGGQQKQDEKKQTRAGKKTKRQST